MQIQGNLPIGSIRPAEQTGQERMALRPGDTLRGEVMRTEDGTALVRLSGGELLRAQVGDDVQLSQGQRVELTVSGMDGDRVILRLSGENMPQSIQAEAVMPRLSGEQQHAARIFGLMREYGMPPTQDGFSRVQSLMDSFPELDERTAVFLAANLKEVPAGGDAPLRALVSALTQQGEGGVAAFPDALMAALSSDAAEPKTAEVLRALLPPGAVETAAQADAGSIAGESTAAGPLAGQPTPEDGGERAATQAVAKFLQQAAPEGYRHISAQGRLADAGALLRYAAALPAEQANALLTSFAGSVAPPGGQTAPDLLPALQRAMAALSAEPQDATQAAEASTIAAPAPEQSGGASTVRQTLPPTAQQAAVEIPQGQPASQLPAAQSSALPRALPDLAQLADSLFARVPGDGDAAGELRRVAETMLRSLNTLREATGAMPGRETAAAVAYQADARAQALPQILQFHYMQMPIALYDRRQTADLYVMKRPGRAREAGEECTVLIALETEHLGRVEAIMRALEKDVTITFRMTPGGAAEAIRTSLPELVRSVDSAGFRLRDAAVSALTEAVTPQTFLPLIDRMDAEAAARLDVRV